MLTLLPIHVAPAVREGSTLFLIKYRCIPFSCTIKGTKRSMLIYILVDSRTFGVHYTN